MSANRWTLRRRLTVLFAGSAVLAILALAIGVGAFVNLLAAREDVVDVIDPAAVTQRDLLAAMIDQETGVRGFTLTATESFLEPYDEGRRVADVSVARLRTLLADEPTLSGILDESAARAAVWQQDFAEPEITRVRLFGAGESTPELLDVGRQRFDDVRASLAELEAELSDARAAARENLDQATSILIGALSGLVAVVFAVGALAWVAFRRWTLAPLERLAADARIVASGDIRHELKLDGPPELVRLGGDVEAMRRRIADDFSELETAQAALDEHARDLVRSNRDLEQFAYVASHDLQEPLRKVTSFCQLLQRRYADQLDERANQYIEFAVDGARRMQVLINDLLTFSRVGRTTETFVDVDTHAIAERAIADLDGPITEADGRVECSRLPVVSGDPTLLLMLFRNLIGNAVKFRGDDPPVIEIDAQPDGEGSWRFVFGDNGIGIEPEYAEKVFVIFQRLHSRDQYEGTGIGLALAKKIVEFHGGTIWLDTTRRRGTAICFTLPESPTTSAAGTLTAVPASRSPE
jgi:signal transduction histidine kinase